MCWLEARRPQGTPGHPQAREEEPEGVSFFSPEKFPPPAEGHLSQGKDRRSKTKEGDLLWLDFVDELASKVEQDMPATLSDFVACVTAACESDITDK